MKQIFGARPVASYLPSMRWIGANPKNVAAVSEQYELVWIIDGDGASLFKLIVALI